MRVLPTGVARGPTERKQERIATLKFGVRLLTAIMQEPERLLYLLRFVFSGIMYLPSLLHDITSKKLKEIKPDASIARRYPPAGTVLQRDDPMPGMDSWTWSPDGSNYEDRKTRYLGMCIERDPEGLIGNVARASLNLKGVVADNVVKNYVERLEGRRDCADFFAIHVLHALYIDRRTSLLDENHRAALKIAILGFKYWLDEPGHHDMIFYTENHQILFHVAEFLAGQLYPSEIFTNNGKPGRWHETHARGLILTWMGRRAKCGYSEWSSSEYFAEDLEGLALLVEFSEDDRIARKATISLDILLLIVACDLFHGYHASTHGRAYEKEILSGWEFDMAPVVKLVWGVGTFGREGVMAGLALATSTKYVPPEAIVALGVEEFPAFESHECSGIPLRVAQRFGLDYGRLRDAPAFWGMGAFSNRPVLDLFVKAADQWHLWDTPFFDFARMFHDVIPRRVELGKRFSGIDLESDRSLLDQVHKITFKTPDYMLSTAQSYRPGGRGNQHHIWQATLSQNAIVFTTNPGSLDYAEWGREGDTMDFAVGASTSNAGASRRTPTYWVGQNRLPRAIQYKNLAIVMYRLDLRLALGERAVYPFTHAFFPKWAFAEVIEEDGWIFGRSRNGYIALASALPTKWENPEDPFCHDIVAQGAKNVWICLLGNELEHGTFAAFREAVKNACKRIDMDQMTVTFDAPNLGLVTIGWNGYLMVNDKAILWNQYPRFSNPCCESLFNSGRYVVHTEHGNLLLDFDEILRETTKTGY